VDRNENELVQVGVEVDGNQRFLYIIIILYIPYIIIYILLYIYNKLLIIIYLIYNI